VSIEASFFLASLIFISAILKPSPYNRGTLGAMLVQTLRKTLLKTDIYWGDAIQNIIELLVQGDKGNSERVVIQVTHVIKILPTVDWIACKQIKEALLLFFLAEPICIGPLQTLWGSRFWASKNGLPNGGLEKGL
jgi:hypothetical protein